jgi:hypothetical protein
MFRDPMTMLALFLFIFGAVVSALWVPGVGERGCAVSRGGLVWGFCVGCDIAQFDSHARGADQYGFYLQ